MDGERGRVNGVGRCLSVVGQKTLTAEGGPISALRTCDLSGFRFRSFLHRKRAKVAKQNLYHRGHEGTQRNATEEKERVIW